MNRHIGLLLASGLLAACSSSTTLTDAGITFDASPPPDSGSGDAGLDSGPAASDIGTGCATDADCDGTCIDSLPGGYCSGTCSTDADCPSDSTCVTVGHGGQSLCFSNCDPAASERTCRAGYGCSSSFMIPGNVCFPGCTDNSDCPGTAECDPTGGFGGAGSCFDPSASIGDACTDDAQCQSGGFCLGEDFAGWPAGACIGFGCDPTAGTGCDADAVCIPGGGGGGGACVIACTAGSDCRGAYTCKASSEFPDRSFCQPACSSDSECSGGRVCNPALGTCDVAFDPTEYGQPCASVRGACQGGSCMSEFETGFPGSYCAYSGCDASAADDADGCPGTGVCIEAGGSTTCLAGCTSDSDCRAPDYACRPIDSARPERGKACVPSCGSDAACSNDGTGGGPVFSCNPGTGLCRPAFEAPAWASPACPRTTAPAAPASAKPPTVTPRGPARPWAVGSRARDPNRPAPRAARASTTEPAILRSAPAWSPA
ncbi:MAG: hypothetical protein GXP55_03220 [Deltaproteobacteria bacterium]|nr:hypothetical protein [Deltaproteobacteria bacterium]